MLIAIVVGAVVYSYIAGLVSHDYRTDRTPPIWCFLIGLLWPFTLALGIIDWLFHR